MGERSRRAHGALARGVLVLAAVGLLGGCGAATQAGLISAAPGSYVTCTTPADGCTTSSQMQARPTAMYLSGDGSLFVRGVVWSGWGSGTTTGTGTAYADDCRPNCAKGTYHEHPATIVLSDPKPWHGKMAYSHQMDSVPAIGWRYTFTRGLLPSAAPPASVSAPPAPGPVSTQATLNGTCTMGYEPAYADNSGSISYGPFTPGTPPGPVTIDGQGYTPTVAYQVSLTNTGTATAQVSGFAVAFYDANGSELGSDQEYAGGTFITASQTLTWTEFSGTDTAGYSLSGNGGTGTQDNNIPATGDAATCSFLQWYHP